MASGTQIRKEWPKLSRLSCWETIEVGAMGRGVPSGLPSVSGLHAQSGCPLSQHWIHSPSRDSRGHVVSSDSFPTESNPSPTPLCTKGPSA